MKAQGSENSKSSKIALFTTVFLLAASAQVFAQNSSNLSSLQKHINKQVTVDTQDGSITGQLLRVEESRIVVYEAGTPKPIARESLSRPATTGIGRPAAEAPAVVERRLLERPAHHLGRGHWPREEADRLRPGRRHPLDVRLPQVLDPLHPRRHFSRCGGIARRPRGTPRRQSPRPRPRVAPGGVDGPRRPHACASLRAS